MPRKPVDPDAELVEEDPAPEPEPDLDVRCGPLVDVGDPKDNPVLPDDESAIADPEDPSQIADPGSDPDLA